MTGGLPEVPRVSFKCTICADCCRDVPGHRRRILALESEVAEIEEASGLGRAEFCKRSGRGDLYEYRMKKPGGRCFFLGADKLCGIYPKRPLVCRFFPFELTGNGEWKVSNKCEGLGCGSPVPAGHFRKLVGEAEKRFGRAGKGK